MWLFIISQSREVCNICSTPSYGRFSPEMRARSLRLSAISPAGRVRAAWLTARRGFHPQTPSKYPESAMDTKSPSATMMWSASLTPMVFSAVRACSVVFRSS